MIESQFSLGTTGTIKIEDNTDDPELMLAVVWLKSSTPISVPQFPWTHAVDGVMAEWKSHNVLATTEWQRLGVVYVGAAQTLDIFIEETGTTELDGPAQFTTNLYGYSPGVGLVNINVNGVWKKAEAYVNDQGTWKLASPYIRTPSGWTELT